MNVGIGESTPRGAGRKVAFGLLVITVGAAFLLRNLGLLPEDVFRSWWPMLLVAYGAYRLVLGDRVSDRVGGLFWMLIGGTLQLDKMDVIDVDFWRLWPVLLIAAGVSIMLRAWECRSPAFGADGHPGPPATWGGTPGATGEGGSR